MAQSDLDMKKMMILFQRRYNSIYDVCRLTDQLADALARKDEVSISMVLEMRAEELAKFDECTGEIWGMCAGADVEIVQRIRFLITSEPAEGAGESLEEKKIYEIRRKTQAVIDQLRVLDERLNRRMAGEKSYYKTAAK